MKEFTDDERKFIKERYEDIFDKLKTYSSEQIGEILVQAYNNGLICIGANNNDLADIKECSVALMIAIGMLKYNDVKLPEKYTE